MAEKASPTTPEQLGALPLVYPVPTVELQRHTFAYRSLPDFELLADLYRPPTVRPEQRRLAVILLHGGPVAKTADPRQWRVFRDYAALLATQDVITVIFNHRLCGPAEYFTAQGDVVALLEHVRAHAATYNIDPERLLLWAFGASGPLLTVGLDLQRPYVVGLIAYYCLLDFAMPMKFGGAHGASREILEGLSPAAQVRRNGCRSPMLMVRAGGDSPTFKRSAATFMEAALASDAAIELLNHPGAEHGFDVRSNDARSREIIARTLQFIRSRAGS
jgi:acetyl esterase/lipase